tara:strand:- start:20373 stop:20828 length:456 start_codon:yes stop_codon:yes gene_type:complete
VYDKKSFLSGILACVTLMLINIIAIFNEVFMLSFVISLIIIFLCYKNSINYFKICDNSIIFYKKNILKKIINKKTIELENIKKIVFKYYSFDLLDILYSVRFYNEVEIIIFLKNDEIIEIPRGDISLDLVLKMKETLERNTKNNIDVELKK